MFKVKIEFYTLWLGFATQWQRFETIALKTSHRHFSLLKTIFLKQKKNTHLAQNHFKNEFCAQHSEIARIN